MLASVASAQEASPAACPEESLDDKKARNLYEEALTSEVTGDLGGARRMFQTLMDSYPQTRFSCWADEHLGDLKLGKARINKEGRAQFIIGATTFGAWAGFAFTGMIVTGDDEFSENEAKAAIWASIGGAAAGLVPSIFLSSDLPMSTGRATLINFAWTWGLWHGMAFSLMPEDDLSPPGIFGLSLAMSAAGFAGAYTLTHYVDVADGDAALISAAGLWSSWFTLATGLLISEEFLDDESVWIPITLTGGDIGVGMAALMSGRFNMSAGRVGLVNLGGLLGGLVGAGVLATAEVDEMRTAVGIMMASTLAGLAAGAIFTRDYDNGHGAGSGVALLEFGADGWKVGAPIPQIMPASVDGKQGFAIQVPLLAGSI